MGFTIKNGFHWAMFELLVIKAKIKRVFCRTYCCYGNALCHKNDTNMFTDVF